MDFDTHLHRQTAEYLGGDEIELSYLLEYVKENYTQITDEVFENEDGDYFIINEDADYINHEGWDNYQTILEEPCQFVDVVNEISVELARVRLELKTLKEGK